MANQHINELADVEDQIEEPFIPGLVPDTYLYNYFRDKFFTIDEQGLKFSKPQLAKTINRKHGERLGCPGLISLKDSSQNLIGRLHAQMANYVEQAYNLDPKISLFHLVFIRV